ncbi:zinc transporter ZIP10 isoform X2 [Sitodiplosis mosellana]|uniref:zinc transporter ZIP10 isoform X2 n=1 Tax=Sitodiplosis mosellana TaxID=263140 RepID=UPI002444E0DF|nr:zinc transporter ZIP10 isoform X2 [Sitodiplosis mosellana]XP_055311078.1 zinc transporter ZIP10 isoform X2 [Sitodiplosis mosellana]XP_055311079.1 zinc transporter ZIP10 isoform X2 [Sitodiplosis mosellana]
MTSPLFKHIFAAFFIVHLSNHIAFAEHTTATENTSSPSTPPKRVSNRFLTHLFRKYGSHGKISFEGFEHLMHNLGIGGIDFPEKHTLNEHRPNGYKLPEVTFDEDTSTFQNEPPSITLETTTPDHSSQQRKTCLSPISLVQMYSPDAMNGTIKNNPVYRSSSVLADNNDEHQHQHQHEHQHQHSDEDGDYSISNIQITPAAFMNMCPALLVQIEQGSCAEQQQQQHFDDEPLPSSSASLPSVQPKEPRESKVISSFAWIAAVVSITIISLCGLIGIAMVPLTKFSAYHEILRFMIAIAIGTLVGDALMHLIPHALAPHDHASTEESHMHGDTRHAEDAHDHSSETEAVWLCGCAFLTALVMYFIEALLPLLSGNAGHGHSHGGHGHGPKISNKVQAEVIHSPEDCQHQQNENQASNCGSCEDLDNDLENSKKNIEENVMVKDTKVRPLGALTPVAFMVIIGDGLHNLTDGMAIGAAFGVDPVTGMATALAVLCHELPHELGDFALLLQTGVSLRRAFVFNVISSMLSFIGMIFGLLIVNANSAFVRWIYAGTAGTFLYIAFADLVPELGRAEQSVKMTLIQALGILIGGIIMLLIGLYEDSLKIIFATIES